MSEERGHYTLDSREQQLNPNSLYRSVDVRYEAPTFEDVRALKALSGETGSGLASRLGVDPRAWRRWAAPPESASAQAIPYPAWRLLLIELGVVEGRDVGRAPVKVP